MTVSSIQCVSEHGKETVGVSNSAAHPCRICQLAHIDRIAAPTCAHRLLPRARLQQRAVYHRLPTNLLYSKWWPALVLFTVSLLTQRVCRSMVRSHRSSELTFGTHPPTQSKSSKAKALANKQMEENIAQFCGVTGASCVTFHFSDRSAWWGV